jgi:hypothetical protein
MKKSELFFEIITSVLVALIFIGAFVLNHSALGKIGTIIVVLLESINMIRVILKYRSSKKSGQ